MKKLLSMLSIMGVMSMSMAAMAMEPEDGYGFEDVTSTTHYNHAVKWAKDKGYFYGQGGTMENPSSTFEPNGTFNRYQMAAVLVRVNGYDLVEETDCFGDEELVEWAAQYVCTLKANGDVQGKLVNGVRMFDGAAAVTNAETMKLAVRANLNGLPAENQPGEGAWYAPLDEWASSMNLVPDMVDNMNAAATRQYVADFLARAESYASGSTEDEKWAALDEYLMMYGDDRHMWAYNTPENRGKNLSSMKNARYMDVEPEVNVKQAVTAALETPGYTAEVMGMDDYEGEVSGMVKMKQMDGKYYLHAELELPELEDSEYYLGWVAKENGDDDVFKQLGELMYEDGKWHLYYMTDVEDGMDYMEYMYFAVTMGMEDGDASDQTPVAQGMFEEYMEMTEHEMMVQEVMSKLEMPDYAAEVMGYEDYEVEGMTAMKYDDGMYYFHAHMTELPELPENYDHYTVELHKEAVGGEEAMMHELGMLEYDEEMGWHLHYKGEMDYSDYMMVKVYTTSDMEDDYPKMQLAMAEYMNYGHYMTKMELEMPDYYVSYDGEGDYDDVTVMTKNKYEGGTYYLSAMVEGLPELDEGQYYEGWVVKKEEGEDDMKHSTGRLMMGDEDGEYYQYYMVDADYSDYMYYVVTLEYENLDDQAVVAEGMYEMYEDDMEVGY